MKAILCLTLSLTAALSVSALNVQITLCANNVGIPANVGVNNKNAATYTPTGPSGNITLNVSAGDVISVNSSLYTGLEGQNYTVTQTDIEKGKVTLCLDLPPKGRRSVFTWKVNSGPLPVGVWDGEKWTEKQTARASNNQNLQLKPGPATITWFVTSMVDDPNRISFNIVADRPGDDHTLWVNKQNNFTFVAPKDIELTLKISVLLLNDRGIYIASPKGATAPFTVTAVVQQ